VSDQAADVNVLGGRLAPCGTDPVTGFFRDGCCHTGPEDLGSHTVCAVVTTEFLEHQLRIGNDLITPMPQYRFPGLVHPRISGHSKSSRSTPSGSTRSTSRPTRGLFKPEPGPVRAQRGQSGWRWSRRPSVSLKTAIHGARDLLP
jgi:uncharacterized protein DUF2237